MKNLWFLAFVLCFATGVSVSLLCALDTGLRFFDRYFDRAK
jgi:hypothetical protein